MAKARSSKKSAKSNGPSFRIEGTTKKGRLIMEFPLTGGEESNSGKMLLHATSHGWKQMSVLDPSSVENGVPADWQISLNLGERVKK